MVAELEHHTLEQAAPLPVTRFGSLRTKAGGEPTTIEFLNRTTVFEATPGLTVGTIN